MSSLCRGYTVGVCHVLTVPALPIENSTATGGTRRTWPSLRAIGIEYVWTGVLTLKPVHHFLLQHVYVSLIFKAGMSKNMASILTFLLSSILHELVMIIVSGKIRGYLFMMQMSQYPLIMIGRVCIRAIS